MGVPPMKIEILTTISGVSFEECYAERTTDMIDEVEVNFIVSSQKVGALRQAAPSWNRRRWKINPALALPEAGALS